MNQKLVNTILLSLAFVAMVIGVHRSIQESDIAGNYWIYMIGFMLYIVYHYRKKKQTE
ncbi:hypothetical protein I0P70_08120 [Pontibacter sp. FD36]|uniref:Uncharacterized protein n=1 Tax=Pontibacter lucknowensis TaxID=1077936 RepID=A0A1N6UML4_9BACT|nr:MULTISPECIES: hypothetical protein [Pontibacter]MBF8963206.1 hypothetical protein [Pontibacter sp. FD36]SIQ66797.1 hypothetical protein SAMN05421545_0967 [Pontibacter lucknowensis]